MVQIQYPEPGFRIKKEDEREFIFDTCRKRWVPLTPEEWVRQNFVQYLVHVKKYPATLVAIEKEIMLGELKKRFDILVYNSQHKPWMMIECKSMDVALNDDVLHQVLRYNISIPVTYLVITNGSYCFAGMRDGKTISSIDELPAHV
jgi:hypothetical protein